MIVDTLYMTHLKFFLKINVLFKRKSYKKSTLYLQQINCVYPCMYILSVENFMTKFKH